MSIKYGDLIENNVISKKDFKRLLNEKKINTLKERRKNLKIFKSLSDTRKFIIENFSQSLSEVSRQILTDFSQIIANSIDINVVLRPITTLFAEFSQKLEEIIPKKWVNKLLSSLNDIKKLHTKKLIFTFSIFKKQLLKYKKNADKRLIIFSEFILYLSSIFENYTKKLIKLFKGQHDSLKEIIYRPDLKSSMKEFYNPVEINFSRLFGYLYNIVDNIKHEDQKFLKRFSKYSCLDLLRESTEKSISNYLGLEYSAVKSFFLRHRNFLEEFIIFSNGKPTIYSLKIKGEKLISKI